MKREMTNNAKVASKVALRQHTPQSELNASLFPNSNGVTTLYCRRTCTYDNNYVFQSGPNERILVYIFNDECDGLHGTTSQCNWTRRRMHPKPTNMQHQKTKTLNQKTSPFSGKRAGAILGVPPNASLFTSVTNGNNNAWGREERERMTSSRLSSRGYFITPG